MQSTSQSASTPLQPSADDLTYSHKADDLTYQALTIVSILLLLGSLWVF